MQKEKQDVKEACIFCKIVNGEIPAAKIYEDDKIISFLDIAPANKGHCLIVPKSHYGTLLEAPDEELGHLLLAAKKITKALSLSCGNGSFNMLMNNGKEAGQLVHHAHIHIIPRFKDDRLSLNWKPKKYMGKEIDDYKEKIKKFL